MKISGFTIARNADRLYFPIKESIRSILPIVDEMIVALDETDPEDRTGDLIRSIGSDKIRIFPRSWSEESFRESRILAEETNFALSQCSGDWCFYLQADEVIHEKDHQSILDACKLYLGREDIDGLLFDYFHFWGDYDHFLPFHGWYKNEIRLIKNHRKIISIKDAQSFRHSNGDKLSVASVRAHVYHYGWVRPPEMMQRKKKVHDGLHRGMQQADREYADRGAYYNYGPLGRIPLFDGSHPRVMQQRIRDLNWQGQLNYTKSWIPNRPLHKHEKWRYRAISWLENHLLGGGQIFGYQNWKLKK